MRCGSLLAGEEEDKRSQLITTKIEYAGEVFGWPNRSTSFWFFFGLYSKVDN
jgi:hypothetical protein